MKEIQISKISFAPIDAKDFCGYRTVGYDYMFYENRRCANTPEEHALLLDMELEYLSGLAELQQHIRDKYIPMLKQLGASEWTDPYADDRQMDREDKWQREHTEERAKVRHLYYT